MRTHERWQTDGWAVLLTSSGSFVLLNGIALCAVFVVCSIQAEDAESVFAGPLALRRKYYNSTKASGAFSCMLWCTIALGALTSKMGSRLVRWVNFDAGISERKIGCDLQKNKYL